MLRTQRRLVRGASDKLVVQFARTAGEIKEAQRLRWKIFGEEMGATLRSDEPGVDRDRFDDACDHLLVRVSGSGEVVGTYRILNAARAKDTGGFYAEGEFDLTRLANLRPRIMEIGRACVHPDYRTGSTIALLWAGLADYIKLHGVQYLIGCASVSMADGGHRAASIYRRLQRDRMAPAEWRVFPHCALPLEALDGGLRVEVPALIKAYLRVGAYVCGDPAWDPDFNTADLLMMLPTVNIDHRYARHFLKSPDAARIL